MESLDVATPNEQSTDDGLQRTSIEVLAGPHRDIFTRAVENVLSSEIAQITYAQIADGLPLSSVEMDTYDYGSLSGNHPLHTKHINLCSGALEKAQKLHARFNSNSLQINSSASTPTMYGYLANLGSYSFYTSIGPLRLAREPSRHG